MAPQATTRRRTPSRTWRRSAQQLGVEEGRRCSEISYGTELAIQYARAYPQHVERLILDSSRRPPTTPTPYFTSRPSDAMSPSLSLAVPGQVQRRLSENPGEDLGQLVSQLRQKPMGRATPTTSAGARTRSRSPRWI